MIVGLAEGIKDAYEFAALRNRTSIGTWTEIDYEMIGSLAANGSQEKSTDLIVIGYVYQTDYIKSSDGLPGWSRSSDNDSSTLNIHLFF